MRKLMIVIASLVIGGSAFAQSFSHARLDTALQAHVDAGQVNYPGLARDANFRAYLDSLAAFDATTLSSLEDRLAFWINAYNALTIKGILNGGSPSSFFGRIGFFAGATYEVGGQTLNLKDLEHKVIIPMGEPRIHFAINCASLSCPVLRSESYEPVRLEAQLESSTRGFLNDPSRNRFDPEARVAHLSKIFDWYDDEFGGDDAQVLTFVARYLDDPALASSLSSGGWRIEYLEYDWSLNGSPPAT